MTELPYFASKVRLGRSGVEEVLPLGPLNEYERLVNVYTFKEFSIKKPVILSELPSDDLWLWLRNRVGLEKAKKELAASIDKGISFVGKWVGFHNNFLYITLLKKPVLWNKVIGLITLLSSQVSLETLVQELAWSNSFHFGWLMPVLKLVFPCKIIYRKIKN